MQYNVFSLLRSGGNSITIFLQASCTLTITPTVANNYTVNGYYAVALTIEDFPKTNIVLNGIGFSTNDALSSIPLQVTVVYLVYVNSFTPSFDA